MENKIESTRGVISLLCQRGPSQGNYRGYIGIIEYIRLYRDNGK